MERVVRGWDASTRGERRTTKACGLALVIVLAVGAFGLSAEWCALVVAVAVVWAVGILYVLWLRGRTWSDR